MKRSVPPRVSSTVRDGWGARALLAPGLCLAVLVAVESAAGAAVPSRPLPAATFTTRVPAGRPVVAFEDDGRIYRLRTPDTHFGDGGIQRPGGVAVFISVYTRAQFGRFYGVDPPRRTDDLFATFTPPGEATEEFRLFAPRRTALGGEQPAGGARYLGATSQGEVIALDRTARSSLHYAFAFFPACRKVTVPGQQDAATVPVSPTARFEDRFAVAYRPLPDPEPVVGGRPRPLLLVGKAALTGRFGPPDVATGTLRDRVGVFDRDAFPAPAAQLDACDTGALTWRAQRY